MSESTALIKSRRVYIRHLALSDEREILSKTRCDRDYHHPWVSPPRTPAQFRARLKKYKTSSQDAFVVCLLRSCEIVGVININEIVRGAFQSGYLGYYGFSTFAGKGYMQEGLSLIVKYAFRKLKLHRLEANIQPGNEASKVLAKRCGFCREGYSPKYLKIGGRWCDHERWAIVRGT